MSHTNLAHWHKTPKCEKCGEDATIYLVAYAIHNACNPGEPLYCDDKTDVPSEDVVYDGEAHWAGSFPRACMDSDVSDVTLCEKCFKEVGR